MDKRSATYKAAPGGSEKAPGESQRSQPLTKGLSRTNAPFFSDLSRLAPGRRHRCIKTVQHDFPLVEEVEDFEANPFCRMDRPTAIAGTTDSHPLLWIPHQDPLRARDRFEEAGNVLAGVVGLGEEMSRLPERSAHSASRSS